MGELIAMKMTFRKVLLASAALIISVLLGSNLQKTASAASNTFSPKEQVVMKGYFSSVKAGYAFHFKSVKVKQGELPTIVFGDFKRGGLTYAIIMKRPTLSLDRRVVKYTYKVNRGGKLSKANYVMYIKKQASAQYTVWLRKTRQGYLPGKSGTPYRFRRTVKSPAPSLANKFLRPFYVDFYTQRIEENLKQQTADAEAKGTPTVDWKNDPESQAKIKETANTTADKTVASYLKNF